MAKNSILVCLLVIAATSVRAQTINWIIFADTHDKHNGTEVKSSMHAFSSQFIDRINDAIIPEGYLPKVRTYSGSEFTEARCVQIINNLTCGKDDIIVFYYLGHGGRAQLGEKGAEYEKKYPWPDLVFDKSETHETINGQTLDMIHNKLKNKGARLTVTLGMCCNIQSSKFARHDRVSPHASKYKIVSKKFAKKVGKALFLRHKGDVLVASAQPNQFSYGCCSYGDQEIDCFTAAICMVTDRYADNELGDDVTWSSFLNQVSNKCSALAKSNNDKYIQTPKVQVHTTVLKR